MPRKKVCEEAATKAVSRMFEDEVQLYAVCDEHADKLGEKGWSAAALPVTGTCQWEDVPQARAKKKSVLPLVEKELPPAVKPKGRIGRPRRWLVWKCEKYLNLRVLIPDWRKDERLAARPYAEFISGTLDTKRFAEWRSLTSEQVDTMNKYLRKTKHVRLETEVPGETYKCDVEGCDYVAKHAWDLAQHLARYHREWLGDDKVQLIEG